MGTNESALTREGSFTDRDISYQAEEGKAALQNPRQRQYTQMQEAKLLMVLTSSAACIAEGGSQT